VNELALFAGAGGGILGGKLLGWRTVCAVEYDEYAAAILAKRQNDGILQPFPIWDDVQTFDGKPWRGVVDVVSGGFPCQDISCAGNRKGIEGKKSGLWKEFARIICEVRPPRVFVENSPDLAFRGLGTVLGDLAEMGYDARWGVFSSADIGSCHIRERIWILAYPECLRPRRITQRGEVGQNKQLCEIEENGGLATIVRDYDGVADRLDRKRCIGNGQDPRVFKLAWETLTP
jgi:DNA (cytosine-5)-methyltransferase 1